MPRYYKQISLDEFRDKLSKIYVDDYENPNPSGNFNPWVLPAGITKDLSKVYFDWENYIIESEPNSYLPLNSLFGFHQDGDFCFFGIYGGGDWEMGIFSIIYWDGKKLRGYIPTDGNPWNTNTHQAYGNDEELDEKNVRKRYKEYFKDIPDDTHIYIDSIPLNILYSADKIMTDIKSRILNK